LVISLLVILVVIDTMVCQGREELQARGYHKGISQGDITKGERKRAGEGVRVRVMG